MEKTTDSVDDWLARNDPDGTLHALDRMIVEALPDADRILWRGVFWGGTEQAIVGYASTRQERPRGEVVEWFHIGLARQKNHVSLYVNAAEGGRYLAQRYGGGLGKVKIGSGSIAFRALEDLDLDALRDLLARAAAQLPG